MFYVLLCFVVGSLLATAKCEDNKGKREKRKGGEKEGGEGVSTAFGQI